MKFSILLIIATVLCVIFLTVDTVFVILFIKENGWSFVAASLIGVLGVITGLIIWLIILVIEYFQQW